MHIMYKRKKMTLFSKLVAVSFLNAVHDGADFVKPDVNVWLILIGRNRIPGQSESTLRWRVCIKHNKKEIPNVYLFGDKNNY